MRGRSSAPGAALLDPLSAVLQDLRLSDNSYGRCELEHPWGIEFPPQPQARFHFVVSGAAWLRAPKHGWLALEPRDVALLPHGTGHALASEQDGRLDPLSAMALESIGDRTYAMRVPAPRGGHGAETVLVCCSLGFAEPSVHPLLELMPSLILVRRGGQLDPMLPVLLDAIAQEVLARRIGAATVMTRLADIVITRVIRAWAESQADVTSGWLAAIKDPQIGVALAAIHQRPGEAWTVESLADVSRTSRSVFAERFNAVVGMPPARYLARWRVHVASGWLRTDRVTVAEAADRLGYDSEAAFSRAFKRISGVAPSTLRSANKARSG